MLQLPAPHQLILPMNDPLHRLHQVFSTLKKEMKRGSLVKIHFPCNLSPKIKSRNLTNPKISNLKISPKSQIQAPNPHRHHGNSKTHLNQTLHNPIQSPNLIFQKPYPTKTKIPFNRNPKPSETQNDNFYQKSKHNFKFPQILDIPDSKIPKILNPRDPNQLIVPTPIPKSKSQELTSFLNNPNPQIQKPKSLKH